MVDAALHELTSSSPRGLVPATRQPDVTHGGLGGATVRPGWIGSAERPLFGWWHVPRTRSARGIVVMAPAMARERLAADHSWHLLAGRLADLGFGVLRIDFSSTGDSAGLATDAGLVTTWEDDVATALATARAATDAPLIVLGHRLGATLAARAIRRLDREPQALVLWDPVLRGKRYLRELTAQQLLAVPGGGVSPDSQWADVPGDDLTAGTAAEIAALNLLDGGPLPARQTLVLARSGGEKPFLPLVDGLERGEVVGIDRQAELLNLDPIQAVHAYDTVERIGRWLDAAFDAEAYTFDPTIPDSVRLQGNPAGPGVTERAGFRTRGTIFTIETAPADAPVRRTVLLLSAGVEVHTGPARLWVDLAREWAAQGIRVVRCDMPGLGDSPARPGSATQTVYEAAAIDELEDLVRELDPTDPAGVVLVGMCSGAYNALEVANRLGSRSLIALAFGWWLIPAEVRQGRRTDRRRVMYRSALARLRPVLATGPGRRALVEHAERFWLVGSGARLTAPLRPFRRLAAAGTRITMVMGASDLRHFTPQERQLRRLRAQPGFRLREIDGLDHGLLAGDARRAARSVIYRDVLDDPVVDR